MIINPQKERNIRKSKSRRRITADMELESYLAFRYPGVELNGNLGKLRRKRLRQDEGGLAPENTKGRS